MTPNVASLLAEYLPLHRQNPANTEMWTGGRFEGGKLFWNMNSGQKVEVPDWKEHRWGKEPSLEELEKSPCVYIKLQDQELKMFTGDCDTDRFFVCKSPDDTNGEVKLNWYCMISWSKNANFYLPDPMIRYCENNFLIERKSSECKWNWVFDKKPACLCFKGV